jgi:hypothetical protein
MTKAIPMLSRYVYLTVSLAVVSVSTYRIRMLNRISKL